ncbi:MAG: hypothetical protein HND47_08255 [Chloroflexi bacterium]|nr:hypothetical protein [Chloroflexota bacterium]
MKKVSSVPIVLSSLIATLAIIVAGLGVFWQGKGQKSEFHTLRGETVTIQGHGLYQYESVSFAAQNIAQDVVTLLVESRCWLLRWLSSKRGACGAN